MGTLEAKIGFLPADKVNFVDLTGSLFPAEWSRSALVLALICIAMVIALFAYLNRRTRNTYFKLWTVAWMFYAVYLAAAIGLQEAPEAGFFVMLRRACIGISALFMFWGSFQLTSQPRPLRELKFGVGMILVWSAVAAFLVKDYLWITLPVFALLGGAGVYTGIAYWVRRHYYQGARVLAFGFLLWGLHLFAFPFLEKSEFLMTLGYIASAAMSLIIAMGMIVEQEVTVAEQNYRRLFDSSGDGIFLVDMWTLKVLDVNRGGQRLTKRDKTELIGRSFVEVCPSLAKHGSTVVDNQKMLQAIFRPYSEFNLTQGNDSTILCEGDITMMEWHGTQAFQVNIRSVVDRKKVGQQLHRAEKLSALGQLIAGVAHELNNPLAVVMGCAQLLAKRKNLDQATRKDAERIQHESERAAKIVRDLLAFARPSEPMKVPMDVNRLVTTILDTRESHLRAANIRLEKNLDRSLSKTKADPHQVEQILINLISNAIHALGDRPVPRTLKVSTEEQVNFIRITVANNGPSIPRDIATKIFDPFFTTKPLGKGTGLGLSISNSIVQEHHGKIWFESEPGKDTQFFVEIPIVPCELEPVVEKTEPALKLAAVASDNNGASHRLLIVDDEPGIVEVLKEALDCSGYTVNTASNGMDAMKQLTTDNYDLIISDMRMPDMDGEKLYQTLHSKNPKMARRIVFVTGDTVSTDTRNFLESTGNRWLSKPFHIADVLDLVDDVLQQKQPAGAGVN